MSLSLSLLYLSPYTYRHTYCLHIQTARFGALAKRQLGGGKVGSAQGPAEAKARLKCGKQEKVTLAVLMLQPHRRRQNKREPRLSAFCAPVVPVFMGLVHRNAQPFSLN